MQINNNIHDRTKETEVVSGLKIITSEYKVKVPVFENFNVKVPIFIEEKIKVPVGGEKLIEEIASSISKSIMLKVDNYINDINKKIDEKFKELKSTRIVEEIIITHKDVEIEKPVFKEIQITKPVYIDKEVINPVLKNVSVINAIITDKPVINAVITDVKINNAIIKDIEVEKAVIREKIVDVIHPRYLNLNGKLEGSSE